jgi:hypothetical protein
MGLDLSPVTDRPDVVNALTELLSLPNAPSIRSVVSFDIATVGVDLAPVPIDEVFDFRRQHLHEHREYARKVRQFVRELGALPVGHRGERLSRIARKSSTNSPETSREPPGEPGSARLPSA